MLIPSEDGWIEIGPDGIPLGSWEWCEDDEEWIFIEDAPVPLAISEMPQTGIRDIQIILIIMLAISLTGVAASLYLMHHRKQNTK